MRAHRLAARRFFRDAPPYCIQCENDGLVTLREKFYDYCETRALENATIWAVISTHEDVEEAERRLRFICGPTVYYDAEGKPTKPPRESKPRWSMPPTDDE